MKTYTTSEIAEYDFTISHAFALTAGYGQKEITVTVNYAGTEKDFQAVTSNMHDFDTANDLEGQEKYEALFELVEFSLDGKIAEWIEEL